MLCDGRRAGFLIGELDGKPAATISCVNYDDRFAFLGCYIVRPDLRGRGFGLHIWQAAIAHAGARTIGLDGVVAQQDNYRKSGFALAYRNVRYGGRVAAGGRAARRGSACRHPARDRCGRRRHGVPGAAPGVPARLDRHYGPCRACADARRGSRRLGRDPPLPPGFKIGPLVADDRAAAEAVLDALIAGVGDGEVFLDVPEPNRDAVALAQSRGLEPVFETARMYTGPVRDVAIHRIFGVTTFELG